MMIILYDYGKKKYEKKGSANLFYINMETD